jgi:hypothetical protein
MPLLTDVMKDGTSAPVERPWGPHSVVFRQAIDV